MFIPTLLAEPNNSNRREVDNARAPHHAGAVHIEFRVSTSAERAEQPAGSSGSSAGSVAVFELA